MYFLNRKKKMDDVKNWLDENALKLLEISSEKNINSENTAKSTEVQSFSRSYDPSNLKIQIPGTTKTETLDFLPTDLEQNSSVCCSNSPQFQIPEPSFNIFDFFHVEWIDVPSLIPMPEK